MKTFDVRYNKKGNILYVDAIILTSYLKQNDEYKKIACKV